MELILKPSSPGQQLIIPSHLSLNFRASPDTGLDFRQKTGEEEGKVLGVLLSWDLLKRAPR